MHWGARTAQIMLWVLTLQAWFSVPVRPHSADVSQAGFFTSKDVSSVITQCPTSMRYHSNTHMPNKYRRNTSTPWSIHTKGWTTSHTRAKDCYDCQNESIFKTHFWESVSSAINLLCLISAPPGLTFENSGPYRHISIQSSRFHPSIPTLHYVKSIWGSPYPHPCLFFPLSFRSTENTPAVKLHCTLNTVAHHLMNRVDSLPRPQSHLL